MNKAAIWLGVWAMLFAVFFGISFNVIDVVTRCTALSLPVAFIGVAIFALMISGGLTVEAYVTFNPRRRGAVAAVRAVSTLANGIRSWVDFRDGPH
jgi:hypothetical protein